MPIEFDSAYWDGCWTHRRGVAGGMKSAVLAAGLGKRMDPLTARHLPKPLFPLGGKMPMAEMWVRRLVESGITDVSMNLCVLSDTIKRHFQDGAKFGARISYVEEEVPTGTLGGTCKQVLGTEARSVRPDEEENPLAPFRGSTAIVPSGDIVTNFDAPLLEEMYEIHQRVGAALTMVLSPVRWGRRKDFGTVVLDGPQSLPGVISKSGRIREFREKDPDSPSNLNNASIYMIETELLRTLDAFRTGASLDVAEPFYDFGKHVFPAMLGQLPYVTLPADLLLWGIQYDGRWFDVGRKRDYLRVNEHVLDGELHVDLPYEKLPWGYLGNGVVIDFSRVRIVPPVVIGNNCIIEPGVTLGPYAVVGDGWVVESGAVIRHSVFWERYPYFSDAGDEVSARDRMVIDRHEVRRGVTVEECIVVGGAIERDVREKTVDVLEDGRLGIVPIDFVPTGTRA
ncbi:MAG TPA: NDP-sugar synthase [Thermoanaerobaculia bacterium]|jgi:mannose-1-phosphate guanylyltransferase/phosphomannomutase